MNDKTGKLENEIERLGFGRLTPKTLAQIQQQEHTLLPFNDKNIQQRNLQMICILDIRRHGRSGEHYLHSYSATMTKDVRDRSMEKYISCSRTFSAGEDTMPSVNRARHILQKDIQLKQMKKAVRIEKKRNRRINKL